MIIFTTKQKKKKKRPINVLFERKKHSLRSFISHHLVPFRNIHSVERIRKDTKPGTQVMLTNRGFGHDDLSASSWPHDPSSGREERKCQTASALSEQQAHVHSASRGPFWGVPFQVWCNMHGASFGGRTRWRLAFSWCDSVGGFSASTPPPFQSGMQFGFQCHRQQQRLCPVTGLGSKTQLSCCDSSRCIFGSVSVAMRAPSGAHAVNVKFLLSRLVPWPLLRQTVGKALTATLQLVPSLIYCSALCFRNLLIFNFLLWKVYFWIFFFFGKYFTIYQIKCVFSEGWILLDWLQPHPFFFFFPSYLLRYLFRPLLIISSHI